MYKFVDQNALLQYLIMQMLQFLTVYIQGLQDVSRQTARTGRYSGQAVISLIGSDGYTVSDVI